MRPWTPHPDERARSACRGALQRCCVVLVVQPVGLSRECDAAAQLTLLESEVMNLGCAVLTALSALWCADMLLCRAPLPAESDWGCAGLQCLSALLWRSTTNARRLHQLSFFRGMPSIMQVVCKFGVPACRVQLSWWCSCQGLPAPALTWGVHRTGRPHMACLSCC